MNPHNECDKIEPRLTAYLVGDLPPDEAETVRNHLDSCPACRKAGEELAPVLSDLKAALAARAASQPRLDARRRAAIRPPRRILRFPLARVAQVAAVFLVCFVLLPAILIPSFTKARRPSAQYCMVMAAPGAPSLGETVSASRRTEVAFAPAEPAASIPPAAPAPSSPQPADYSFKDRVGPDRGAMQTHEPRKPEEGVKVQNQQRSSSRPSTIPQKDDSTVIKTDFQPKFKAVTGTGLGMGTGYGLRELGTEVSKFDYFGIPGKDGKKAEAASGEPAVVASPARPAELPPQSAQPGVGGHDADGEGLVDEMGTHPIVMKRTYGAPSAGRGKVALKSHGGGVAANSEVKKDESGAAGFTYEERSKSRITSESGSREADEKAKKAADERGRTVMAVGGSVAWRMEDRQKAFQMAEGVKEEEDAVGRLRKEIDELREQSARENKPAQPTEVSMKTDRIEQNKDVSKQQSADAQIAQSGPQGDTQLKQPARQLAAENQVVEASEEIEEFEIEDLTQEPVFPPQVFNPVVQTRENPFSTFSIDVDTASFTLARRYLLAGKALPPEAVRVEEFINAFEYAYPPPAGAFAVYADRAPSPFRQGLELLRVAVRGRVLGRDRQKPAVLTFVLDTSGSMNTPDRLNLARQALRMLLEQLGPNDRVAIVQFASEARLVLDFTPASEKRKILDTLNSLQISGSTQLEGGVKLGYEVAAHGFRADAVNRVLLLSDGAANLGAANAEEILKPIEAYRKQGIYCSVFGVGTGAYNDAMLQTLADKGDGVYRFIDSLSEARRVFVDELAATLHVIAKDVKIQVEFDPDRVKSYRQIGYEKRHLEKEQFRDDTVDAGEVGSGQASTALYELELQGDPDQPLGVVRVRWRDPESGAVTEIEQPIRAGDRNASFEKAPVRFRLAAGAAEFAEILRGSPYAATDIEDVTKILRPAALELSLDQKVQDLARMANAAEAKK